MTDSGYCHSCGNRKPHIEQVNPEEKMIITAALKSFVELNNFIPFEDVCLQQPEKIATPFFS